MSKRENFITDNLHKITDKFIYIDLPADLVDSEGKDKIVEYLIRKLAETQSLEVILGTYNILTEDIEWVWKTTRGTLPKRLASALYQKFKLKLDPAILSEVGNMIKMYTSDKQTILADFVPLEGVTWWYRGFFEESNSCYWSEKNGARALMEDNRFWSFRIWSDVARKHLQNNPTHTPTDLVLTKNSNLGLGRVWIMPDNDCLVVFNGYAKSNPSLQNNATLQITRLIALYLGLSYKKIKFKNCGTPGGLLWINNEGSAYLVGKQADIDKVDLIDPNIKEEKYDGEPDDDEDEAEHYCAHCEEPIEAGDEWIIDVDGDYACSRCKEEHCCQPLGHGGAWYGADSCNFSDYHQAYILDHESAYSEWLSDYFLYEECDYLDNFEDYIPKSKMKEFLAEKKKEKQKEKAAI